MNISPLNARRTLIFGFLLYATALCFFGALARANDTVSLVLIDGDMHENWPDHGVVGFHRMATDGDLTVNYAVGGTAQAGTDYTASASGAITIPAGDREAWLEFAPTGNALGTPVKTITVALASGSGYDLSSVAVAQTASISLADASPALCAKAAVRFLFQAGFGPNGDFKNVNDVMTKGYDAWITDQFTKPVGLQQPYLNYLNRIRRGKVYSDSRAISWWNRVMEVPELFPGGPRVKGDPLRQRVAFALSEIFVISDHMDDLDNNPIGMLNYYDMLLKGAFGNYRDLLYNVGSHPCMGIYLSHLQNEKGDPVAGTFADENFAREIMQLFTIGIWELNPDGSRKLDTHQQPIPTYDNTTIANMARVMTGFSFGGPKGKDFWDAPDNYTAPMRMWDAYHDLGPKTLLGGVSLPERTASDPDKGTAGLLDFNAAIDCLFNHPNIAPFVSKQLIQKLVTSNPSPQYVGRVAAVFADNGQGVRGDMKAILRAILLDTEARDPAKMSDPAFGKMKEPYLRTANLVRAFNAKAGNGVYQLNYLGDIHFQEPLSAPSVFNFFKPGYSPDGPLSDAGLVGPEFQILNAVTALNVPNYYSAALQYGFNRWGSNNPRNLVLPQFKTEMTLIEDVPALMRRLDLLMTGGTLPNEQHQVIREAVEQINNTMWQWKKERVRMAVYLISTSPEFAVLR